MLGTYIKDVISIKTELWKYLNNDISFFIAIYFFDGAFTKINRFKSNYINVL